MIVMVGGRHHTPVLVHNKKAYVIEALGTSKSKVGVMCATQIAMALQKSDIGIEEIITFEENRQYDSVSCGADSYIALKQALRLTDNLDDFVKGQKTKEVTFGNEVIFDKNDKNDPYYQEDAKMTQVPRLPPQIAKYIQVQSMINRHDFRHTKIPFSSSESLTKSKESMVSYALRHQKITSMEDPLKSPSEITIDSSKPEEDKDKVTLKGRKIVISNAALSQRREKHARIVKKMIEQEDIESLRGYVKESSGVNLICKHIDSIPPYLLIQDNHSATSNQQPATAGDKRLTKQELVEKWVDTEMQKKRTGQQDVVPETSILTELAVQLTNAKSKPR